MTKAIKFSDPATERETYVTAMFGTLVDLAVPDMTERQATEILLREGFQPADVNIYIDAAFERFRKIGK